MKKLTFLFSLIIVFTALLLACDKESLESDILPYHQYGDNKNNKNQEQILYHFVSEKLLGSNGVFTNYKDTNQDESYATGHEILSESMGLLMRYYALTSQQDKFDESLQLTEDVLLMDSGFSYRYSPKHNRLYSVNAAVDDLRIIRALYEAADIFNNESYLDQANMYSNKFMKYNVHSEYLFDFYDEEYKIRNDFITLCYIDLRTINNMPNNSYKVNLLENMSKIIQEGYLSDQFPFYETRYSYVTNDYQSEDINTVESLLTILSLTEVGLHRSESIDYIKKHVSQGTLYGKYSRDGTPKTDIQSTAIYAITAMIGTEVGDQTLYDQSIANMEKFQILNQDTELYGAYGDLGSLQAYSFDNLQALLAYAY